MHRCPMLDDFQKIHNSETQYTVHFCLTEEIGSTIIKEHNMKCEL
jgi:hypothetical protein